MLLFALMRQTADIQFFYQFEKNGLSNSSIDTYHSKVLLGTNFS